ncbi:NitT/TauT family transport system substrate-binding protein [Nocardia transvalensis]|uniref:NitT/TauT family transport system substrate-binding protein n=1 Tax=Nocardia transvalensis TaxID=37333 RepID=A0A7W9PLH6_9NOCA|nr:ABC transporter substrate-binding protein [Nocardia transvalensis]MBB5918365.1 NitT/TauT family transport system substrate-binding protein [Nocardia transvalensis]
MKRPLRALLAAVFAVVTLAGLTACISTPDSVGGSDPHAIRIGTLRGQPHLYAPYFMQRFAPAGTTYEIVLFENSPDIKNALASGAVDFGLLGAPSMLAGIAAGQDVRIIASAANGGSGFVGRPEITTPNDLRGKKIGYPAGSSQEILLKLTLRAHGLDPATDVQLVNLAYSDMVNAYRSGQIDGFLSAETGVSLALRAGARQILSPYDTAIGGVNIVLGTRGELLTGDRERARQTVHSLIQALNFMKSDHDAWAQGLVDTFGLDRAVADTSVGNVTLRWELDDEYRQRVAALAEQMVAFDQLPQAPDMTKVFDTGVVETAGA